MSDDVLKRMQQDLGNAKGKAKPMPKGKSDFPIGEFKQKRGN